MESIREGGMLDSTYNECIKQLKENLPNQCSESMKIKGEMIDNKIVHIIINKVKRTLNATEYYKIKIFFHRKSSI